MTVTGQEPSTRQDPEGTRPLYRPWEPTGKTRGNAECQRFARGLRGVCVPACVCVSQQVCTHQLTDASTYASKHIPFSAPPAPVPSLHSVYGSNDSRRAAESLRFGGPWKGLVCASETQRCSSSGDSRVVPPQTIPRFLLPSNQHLHGRQIFDRTSPLS